MFRALLATMALSFAVPAWADIDGWIEYPTGGDTLCARGEAYSFFVYPGASDKVIVDFIGGGACWDAETCDVDTATFTDSVEALREQAREGLQGVYDKRNPANPYRGWTHVVVPYCTGDVHWGQADVTYTRANGTSFTIHHRGSVNTQAVIDWVKANYPHPANMLVTGCSAGSYGSVYYTPHLREAFPSANLRQLGDAGAGILTPEFREQGLVQWNVAAAAPSWIPTLDPAHVDYKTLTLTEYYRRAAAYYPDVTFAQYNTAYDFIQRLFYVRMGGDPDLWSGQMYDSIDGIHRTAPNFRSYIAGGDAHCATVVDDFYDVTADGVPLKSWVGDLVSGREPGNVRCRDGECGEP
jgi:hypothetical protein